MQAWFLLFISALTLPLLSPSDALAEDSPAAGAETIPFTAPRAPILFAPLVCPEGSKLVGKVPPAALEQGCEAELSSGVKVRRGPWREWYADGTLASAGDYLDGEMQGDWVRYHPNGLLSASGAYLRGQEHGLWATYNSAGRLIQAGSFSRAEKVGAWKSWYENGAVMEAGSYLGGLREGRWTFYYETGSRKEEGFFAAGQKSGRWTRWDAAGRKVEEGQYHLDEKVGPWTTWHGDSALVEAVTVKPEEIAPPSPDPSRDGILGTDGKALLLSDIQRDAAEEMGVIGEQELKGLKPSLWRLPPNPKSTTDFTAYTLEAGEFKIGLLSIGVGIFDNFQMSTMPTLWLAGLPNLVAKVDAIRRAPSTSPSRSPDTG
jgi:antitoxin component YwqK of YwqJK toxin-antitoxin module